MFRSVKEWLLASLAHWDYCQDCVNYICNLTVNPCDCVCYHCRGRIWEFHSKDAKN